MIRKPGAAERVARVITHFAGSTAGFSIAFALVVGWALSGPAFGYSENWQLVINTSTTIVTFLMVFLIQRTQNKDALAIQLKLSEIVAALEGASNRLVGVEDVPEAELKELHRRVQALASSAMADSDLRASRSLEESAPGSTIRGPASGS